MFLPGCSRTRPRSQTPSHHQVVRHICNGSTVYLVWNDTEVVSRVMPEQGQVERLCTVRNGQRSACPGSILMVADGRGRRCDIGKIDDIRTPESRDRAIEVE